MRRTTFFLSLMFLLVSKVSFSQLVADAGPDQAYCTDWNSFDVVVLGGNPTATGGVAPYTYTWEVDHAYGIAAFIDDPSLANPVINESPLFSQTIVQFYLTVTDAEQNVSTDTMNVAFSNFVMILSHYYFTIDLGDTICVNDVNVFGGFPPIEYLWIPNHGLIDSIGTSMCAAPEYPIWYHVKVTDSVGCVVVGDGYVRVFVRPVGIDKQAEAEKAIRLFPNPATGFIQIEIDPEIPGNFMLTMHNDLGQQVMQKQLEDHLALVELQGIGKGMYFCKITNDKGFEYTEKIHIK